MDTADLDYPLPEGAIAQIYRNIARLVAARLAEQARAQARGGPIILIQDD